MFVPDVITVAQIASPLTTTSKIGVTVEVSVEFAHIIFDETGQPLLDEDGNNILEEY